MAQVPLGQKFHTVPSNVQTEEKGSKLANSQREIFTMQDIADTTRPYKVFTALLTQIGGDGPDQIQGDSQIQKGVTYEIANNPYNEDFVKYGAPNNNVGTKFVSNSTEFMGYDASTALDFNTGAPVATVLENTIGNVWFTYFGVGIYLANSDGLFTANKSIILSIPNQYAESPLDLYNYQAYNQDIDSFSLASLKNYLNEDGLYGGYAQTTIEIRVYN